MFYAALSGREVMIKLSVPAECHHLNKIFLLPLAISLRLMLKPDFITKTQLQAGLHPASAVIIILSCSDIAGYNGLSDGTGCVNV